MVNRILEEGASDVQTLPETVHSVLAARLDSLQPTERRVLQHASVVGQTFWEGSLNAVAEEERIELHDTLDSLRRRTS
jgi:predicted ATPase